MTWISSSISGCRKDRLCFEAPRGRAGEESDSVKDFLIALFAYPADEPTGKRIQVTRDEFDGFHHRISHEQRTDVVNAPTGI